MNKVLFELNDNDCVFILEFHYLLELNLANPRIAETWVQGFIKVNLYGSTGEVTDLNLTPE